MLQNFIAAAIVVLIIGAAVLYMIRQKKKGATCIGCPYSGKNCARHCADTKNTLR